MPKLEDSAKGEKSFGLMNCEPPYTRPVLWCESRTVGFNAHGRLTDFIYNETVDHYVCPQGKVIPFTKVFFRLPYQDQEERVSRKKACLC
jgi:hypothetical protein